MKRQKLALIAAVVIIVAVFGYFFWKWHVARNAGSSASSNATSTEDVVVLKSEQVNGQMSAPEGLPSDIPVEDGITESVTVTYPDQNAKQLTVSYQSDRSVEEKYSEYKAYMTKAGYSFTESPASSPVKAIFGTKGSINLSVAVSKQAGGKTLVQLSYLATASQ